MLNNESENIHEITIVGAGASGLSAGKELVQAGKKVLILEGRDRIGGRIHTLNHSRFSVPIEAGAEFIHGKLPLTKSILKEAGIEIAAFSGNSYQIMNNKLVNNESFIGDFPLLISKLKSLTSDIPLSEFFSKYLRSNNFENIKESLQRFAEGYDAADIHRVSTLTLRTELLNMQNTEQYHPQNGYKGMVGFLAERIKEKNGTIKLSSVVREVHWEKGRVKVVTNDGKEFLSKKILITIPASIIQDSGSKVHINFFPDLPEVFSAFRQFGYGGVIKIFLEFKTEFWEKGQIENVDIREMKDLGFIYSDAPVAIWWKNSFEKQICWLAG